MRNNSSYRRFYARIRRATDTRAIGELMKQAYEARQDGNLSFKHFIALNTAADNQRERLLSAPLSATAYKLIDEIVVMPSLWGMSRIASQLPCTPPSRAGISRRPYAHWRKQRLRAPSPYAYQN